MRTLRMPQSYMFRTSSVGGKLRTVSTGMVWLLRLSFLRFLSAHMAVSIRVMPRPMRRNVRK